jgi:hypothetical protein
VEVVVGKGRRQLFQDGCENNLQTSQQLCYPTINVDDKMDRSMKGKINIYLCAIGLWILGLENYPREKVLRS